MESKYILGIAELDAQHEEIEAIFTAFQGAIESEDRGHDVPDILKSLHEKVKFHFQFEESVMQIFSYPEAEEHKKSHQEIMRAVEVYNTLDWSSTNITELDLAPMELFYEQILSKDLRFARHIASHKDRLGIQ